MNVVRAFIAFELTPALLQRLAEVLTDLQSQMAGAPVRWVPAENLHLTLKFLGDVSVKNLEMLQKILQLEAACHHPFDLSVTGLGAFPSPRRARVIWAGVDAPPVLTLIQKAIEDETSRLGYAREERPFSPHLTLGRVSRNATPQDTRRISDVLEKMEIGQLGTMRVQQVDLYKSDLQPGGAVYTRLFRSPLSAA